MLSMQTKLYKFYTALTDLEELGCKVYHDDADSRADFPYLVWSEEAEDESLNAENRKQEQSIAGFVNYYTTTEFDPIVDMIQDVLNDQDGLSWTLASRIPYDPAFEGNNAITYSWTWRLR